MTLTHLYVPGWGYPAYWWKNSCGGNGLLWSWGYYEERVTWPLEKDFWIIVHSFGFYMLPEALLERSLGILWYGGFLSAPLGSSKMLEKSLKDPTKISQKFVQMLPPPSLLCESPLVEKMVQDLERIVFFDYDTFWHNGKDLFSKLICVFGEKDRIAPPLKLPCTTFILPQERHLPDEERGQWKEMISLVTHL